MTTDDLAGIVARARDLLRDWDGRTAAAELAESVREVLRPVAVGADRLSSDARDKLAQVQEALEELSSPGFSAADRESLDMLMLGLWIRIDNAFTPAPNH